MASMEHTVIWQRYLDNHTLIMIDVRASHAWIFTASWPVLIRGGAPLLEVHRLEVRVVICRVARRDCGAPSELSDFVEDDRPLLLP